MNKANEDHTPVTSQERNHFFFFTALASGSSAATGGASRMELETSPRSLTRISGCDGGGLPPFSTHVRAASAHCDTPKEAMTPNSELRTAELPEAAAAIVYAHVDGYYGDDGSGSAALEAVLQQCAAGAENNGIDVDGAATALAPLLDTPPGTPSAAEVTAVR